MASTLDVRTLPGYAEAKQSGRLVVTDPAINPDTGYPIIYARVPIVRDGVFIGCATANLTFDVLSRFLANHRASPNSKTIIADPNDGRIVAASERKIGVRLIDGHLQIARLENVGDEDAREAYRLQAQTKQDEFLFRSPRNGQELSASFARFPEAFGTRGQAIVLTPTDDFIGQLKATNRQIIVMIAALSALELFLIYFLSRRLSQPIESISRALKSIEDFVLRPSDASSVQSQGNRPASVSGGTIAQFAAVVLRVRARRSGKEPRQIGNSAGAGRGKAVTDNILLRCGEFLDRRGTNAAR